MRSTLTHQSVSLTHQSVSLMHQNGSLMHQNFSSLLASVRADYRLRSRLTPVPLNHMDDLEHNLVAIYIHICKYSNKQQSITAIRQLIQIYNFTIHHVKKNKIYHFSFCCYFSSTLNQLTPSLFFLSLAASSTSSPYLRL